MCPYHALSAANKLVEKHEPPNRVQLCGHLTWTSSLQNCMRINFYCLKPLKLWLFDPTVLGNSYSHFSHWYIVISSIRYDYHITLHRVDVP